jgi:hypothetical protein
MKRRRIIIAALLIAAVGGIAWLAFGPANRPDPIYNGKPLSKWLERYDKSTYPVLLNPRSAATTNIGPASVMVSGPAFVSPTSSPELVAADEALAHFGTNAIPTIAWMLRKHDPAWRLKLLQLLGKQHIVAIHYNDPAHWNRAAITALDRMWRSAATAVPVMSEVYDEGLVAMGRTSGHDYWGEHMSLALPDLWIHLGPSARAAIPSLIRGATFTNANVRWVAVSALGKIRSDPAVVIPVLTNAFRDPDMFVRQNALIALSEFGKDAEPLIPAIAEMLNDREHWVQTAALNALGNLHANPALTIPALNGALHNTNVYFALDVARTLQGFGPDARPAVPAMIEVLKRLPNEMARSNMRSIIDQIEPGAVERAGIK